MAKPEDNSRPTLLIADDDTVFCDVLGLAMVRRGFLVLIAQDVPAATREAERIMPDYAVVDLQMPGPSGLVLVDKLRSINDQIRIVVLTGYASIATAVEAIKLGATHYLTKPADADQIVAAFYRDDGDRQAEVPTQTLSVNRLEWEHIQQILNDRKGNISEAARQLGMHRRTLQRKLNKRPVKR